MTCLNQTTCLFHAFTAAMPMFAVPVAELLGTGLPGFNSSYPTVIFSFCHRRAERRQVASGPRRARSVVRGSRSAARAPGATRRTAVERRAGAAGGRICQSFSLCLYPRLFDSCLHSCVGHVRRAAVSGCTTPAARCGCLRPLTARPYHRSPPITRPAD